MGRIFLKVERMDDGFAFYFKTDANDEYKLFTDKVPVEYLSLGRSNGFMGNTIGLYASQEEEF